MHVARLFAAIDTWLDASASHMEAHAAPPASVVLTQVCMHWKTGPHPVVCEHVVTSAQHRSRHGATVGGITPASTSAATMAQYGASNTSLLPESLGVPPSCMPVSLAVPESAGMPVSLPPVVLSPAVVSDAPPESAGGELDEDELEHAGAMNAAAIVMVASASALVRFMVASSGVTERT